MNIEQLRDYCLSLPATSEGLPFGDDTLVFKVGQSFKTGSKMFALVSLKGPLSINLKCDPDKALELREEFPAVKPGYHMNKKLWNTVSIDGSVDDATIRSWIDDSYKLIVHSLPKKVQQEIQER